ncbi:MAG: reverse transcriptase domain-containing protein, partial [Roseimicrobium sp.]
MFTPFLLGRNMTDAIDEVYGRPSAWSKDGVAMPLGEEISRRLAEGVPVTLSKDLCSVSTSAGQDSKLEQIHRLAFYVHEADLLDAIGGRVMEVSGFFDHDGQRNSALVPMAIVAARVDWTKAGKRGLMRRLLLAVDVQAVLDGGGDARVLLKEGTRMGTFFLGRPIVAALTAPDDDGEALLREQLIARTLRDNPLLSTKADQGEVAAVITCFKLAEDLPVAGLASAEPFHIRLKPGAIPFARRNYEMNQAEEEFAERQIKAWLKNGNIVESQSPWSSPILMAKHPRTGKLRFCVDYRALNALTINDSYLLPRIEDITRAVHVSRAKVFSKIDLSQGFTQTPIHEDSQDYTSFRGPRHGMFKFAGGCFGLRNMPPAFQRLMDRIVGDMLWQRACVYVDDVLVFTKTVAEHHVALRELAARFTQFNIYVRASKCDFYQEEVEFLGYYLSEAGLRVLPDRVAGVIDVTIPANKEELRIFMGLTGQFRHLVHNYAEIAAPLEAMKHPQSKMPFDLGEGSTGLHAFQNLKLELIKMPTLIIPDMNLPFTFWCD